MTGFRSLSRAMALGFFRDRTSLFFTILFPLMFLVLFGGLFANQTTSRLHVLEIGSVGLIDQMPAADRTELDQTVEFTPDANRDDALAKVRSGDVDAAIEQTGATVTLHYSAADPVKAGACSACSSPWWTLAMWPPPDSLRRSPSVARRSRTSR